MPVIIFLCILLLLAYIFDISSKFTKILSVILLIVVGIVVKQFAVIFKVQVPNLQSVLPVLGTIGLILIVLEGSLELEVSSQKKKLILNSFWMSLIPMVLLTALISFLFKILSDGNWFDSILNALPLSVISSAIAIPSVKNLSKPNKEFIVYESSFSDILGVLFFNFFQTNNSIDFNALTGFSVQILIMFFLAFIATIILSVLLNNIRHQVKFAPIILLVILIYNLSKVYHLPALIFVLIFGLFLGNLQQFERIEWLSKLKPVKLKTEVHKFTEVVMEAAFIVRATFFILFGFMMDLNEILNPESFLLAFEILVAMILFRVICLLIFKMPVIPLMFIAPRGLITILLFLEIVDQRSLPIINNSLIIQVVLLTAFWMMLGLMFNKSIKKKFGLEDPPEPTKGVSPADENHSAI